MRRFLTQRGSVTVEFAVAGLLLLMLLLAVIESGRAIFIWNSAAEITRRAARLAVVCPAADSAITTLALRGSRGLPGLAPTHLQFRYLSLGGGEVGAAAAAFVQVVLRDYRVALLFPYGYHYTLPPLRTTLPVESLGYLPDSGGSGCPHP